MPFTDYNKVKKISPTSQNDSGSTIQKAQPIILEQGQRFDGYNGSTPASPPTAQSIEYDVVLDEGVRGGPSYFEIGTPSSSQSSITIEVLDQSDNVLLSVSGTVEADGCDSFLGSQFDKENYSRIPEGETITISIFTTDGTSFYIDDDFSGMSGEFSSIAVGQSIPDARDDQSCTASHSIQSFNDDQVTGDGSIGLDWSNISGPEDVAVYDQNGNLLDYEIESLDTTAETGVLWAYNSWVRDDTVQAQIAYGNNSANTDRQNVTGTWDNIGQNAVMVQHLQDNPLTATDSTSNNNDGTVNGAVSTSGQFDGAASFDGTDDEIADIPTTRNSETTMTVVSYPTPNSNVLGNVVNVLTDLSDFSTEGIVYQIQKNTSDEYLFRIFDESGNDATPISTTTASSEETNQIIGTYNGSNVKLFVDSTEEASENASFVLGSPGSPETFIGSYGGGNYWNGKIDEVRIYSEDKSQVTGWIQADYDASPKAGQVFFSQQAAETTVQTQEETFSQSLSLKSLDVTEGVSQTVILENRGVPEQFNQDVAVKDKDVAQSLDTDVAIRDKDVAKTFTQDATLLDRDAEKTFSQTVSLELEDQQETFSQDIILSAGNIETFNQDVSLENRDAVKQVSQDLILENANIPEQFNQDVAVKNRDVEVTFNTSLLVADKDNEETLTQDVYVSQRMTASFDNSVVIARQPAPNTKNPLTAKVTKPSRTFAKVLKPSSTYVEVKEVNEP